MSQVVSVSDIVSNPSLVELVDDNMKNMCKQMLVVTEQFKRYGQNLMIAGQVLNMYKTGAQHIENSLKDLEDRVDAKLEMQAMTSVDDYRSEKQFDLRVLITVMEVFHRTSGGLPFLEFIKQGSLDVETSLLCVLSESGMRRIPEIYAQAFKCPKLITKPLMTQRLFARLRKLKITDGKVFSYMFPYMDESSSAIVVPLSVLMPYILQERKLMASGQSLLRPEILANPSSYVEPEIKFEDQKKTENQIKVDVAKRLGLIDSRKRSVLHLEGADKERLDFALKRRNYGYKPATDVKLIDPAFQSAAACIAGVPGANATGVAYEGHWTYKWAQEPDNHHSHSYVEVGSKRALPKKAAGSRKKARKE